MKKSKSTARPKKERRGGQLPATGTASDTPHVGRALKGCGCIQCEHHRTLERRSERDWAIAKRYEDEPMVGEATWHVHHRR